MKAVGYPVVAIALVLCGAVPVAARQHAGVLLGRDSVHSRAVVDAFKAELARKGVDLEFLTQKPNADPVAWANVARKFSAFEVALIFAVGAPVPIDVINRNIDVPIIFAVPTHEGTPVRDRVTGVSWEVPHASVVTYLQAIREFKHLAVIGDDGVPESVKDRAEFQRLAATFAYELIAAGTDGGAPWGTVDATFLTESCVESTCLERVLERGRARGVLSSSVTAGAGERGVLLTLEGDPVELGTAAGRMAVDILEGKSPATIPVVAVKKVAMAINLKEASAMGIKVPFDVLSAAARVIK